MAKDLLYHGSYTPEQYKLGERQYRTLGKLPVCSEGVTISILWPEPDAQRYVRLKGPVSRFFRYKEAPFVELKYLEYDEISDNTDNPALPLINEWLQNLRNSTGPDDLKKLGADLTTIANFDYELQTLQIDAGIIPIGIYNNEPEPIDLSVIRIFKHSIKLCQVGLTCPDQANHLI